MRTLLHAASLRHLLRHPAQLLLALLGLALGVGTIVAVDLATASSRRAFELSLAAVNGAATHQITGGSQGVDEQLYVQLRLGPVGGAAQAPAYAPVLEGYVTLGGRTLQLLGVDPIASAELSGGATLLGGGDAAQLRELLTEPGAVLMSARTAAELGLRSGSGFEVSIDGE